MAQWASCRQCVRSVSISLRSVRLNRRKRQRFVAVALLGVSHIPPHTGRRAGSLPAAPVRCNVSYVSHPFVCGYILRQDRHAAVCRCGRSGRTILPAGVVFHAVPIYALLCSLSLLSRRMRQRTGMGNAHGSQTYEACDAEAGRRNGSGTDQEVP